jgi:arylformamidase
MTSFDISRMIQPGMAVWPGDTPYQLKQQLRIADGETVNLTTIHMSAHTASHVDAPLHYVDSGHSIDALDLSILWGRAQVVSVVKNGGPIYPDDLVDYDLSLARRILIRSNASSLDPSVFPPQFVYPSPELADQLGEQGIILFGTDAPSVDAEDSKSLSGHLALDRNGIKILEWLNLSDVPDGLYELAALPLKIYGGDGSPVRAALRTIS